MDDELREFFKQAYANAAKTCSACTHKCFLYVLITYIDENSFEYLQYQKKNGSLPMEVEIAEKRFWDLFGHSLEPGVLSTIIPPWC